MSEVSGNLAFSIDIFGCIFAPKNSGTWLNLVLLKSTAPLKVLPLNLTLPWKQQSNIIWGRISELNSLEIFSLKLFIRSTAFINV